MSAGRRVFSSTGASASLIFESSLVIVREDDSFLIAGWFSLPASMVKELSPVGEFILTSDCFIAKATVLNEKNEECVMIKGGNPRSGVATEVLIPCKLLFMLTEPSREAYPQQWR